MSARESWLRFAVMRAALGERIVYVCARRDSTREAIRVAEKMVKQAPFNRWVARICWALGEQQIRFTSGGTITFLVPRDYGWQGLSADALISEPEAHISDYALVGVKTVHRTSDNCPRSPT
ncbi:hypothetical protein [Mycobacteroides abscessus]|uniref:hypothetical protein n=1 Tax=Mycobacteroides abscessus TaxID=36809 RepID=UPI0019D3194D|nr:hypothetical protein [Mycobacteroides abscessus]MBN7457588.1 hypothetical protein [Mycobacteroides abscessus subsp. abscessus]QST90291.1 hypothetical protein PROPHIGD62-1_18 [Mycobacterium phage prophi62-1]